MPHSYLQYQQNNPGVNENKIKITVTRAWPTGCEIKGLRVIWLVFVRSLTVAGVIIHGSQFIGRRSAGRQRRGFYGYFLGSEV